MTKATRQGKRVQGIRMPLTTGSAYRIVIIRDGQFVQAQTKSPAMKATASR